MKVHLIPFQMTSNSFCSHLAHMDKSALEDKTFRKSCWFDNAAHKCCCTRIKSKNTETDYQQGPNKSTNFWSLRSSYSPVVAVQKWNFWPQKWQRCSFKAHKACRPVVIEVKFLHFYEVLQKLNKWWKFQGCRIICLENTASQNWHQI